MELTIVENISDDLEIIQKFRESVNNDEKLDKDYLLTIADRYEEMLELAGISIQMIDHLVKKHHLPKK